MSYSSGRSFRVRGSTSKQCAQIPCAVSGLAFTYGLAAPNRLLAALLATSVPLLMDMHSWKPIRVHRQVIFTVPPDHKPSGRY